MTKKPKLTMKQAKFVRGIAEGKPATVSAQEAYDVKTYETAAVIASENLNKPNVKDAIEQAMIKLNITPELAIAPIGEALLHDDLDMRLKGSDRALKLMQPNKEGGNTIIFNKGDIVRSKYVKD